MPELRTRHMLRLYLSWHGAPLLLAELSLRDTEPDGDEKKADDA